MCQLLHRSVFHMAQLQSCIIRHEGLYKEKLKVMVNVCFFILRLLFSYF